MVINVAGPYMLAEGEVIRPQIFLFGEPWIDLSKNQVGDIGDVMINDYEYPINHPILLKKDG